MINNKALVCSYVAKMFADGTKYHESIKESDNIGYIYGAVEELLNTKLSKQESTKARRHVPNGTFISMTTNCFLSMAEEKGLCA